MSVDKSESRVVNTMCSQHCNTQCLIRAHVRDGVITRVETDDGPEPQYRCCLRGHSWRKMVHSPDRVLYPLRRIGERGEGKFERISWNEALDTVAFHLRRVRETYDPGARILLTSAGELGWMHNAGLVERLLVRDGGYTGVLGCVSGEGTWFASMATYGVSFSLNCSSRDSYLKSKLIIMWGWNPAVQGGMGNIHYYMNKIKKAGIRVVYIDPRYTESAALLADQWIPIKPATDTAMAIAMAYVIITERLEDRAFLDKYTVGFGKFEDYVLGREDGIPKTPAWAEAITGVPAETVADLAREYATTKPAALLDGFAPGRTSFGEQFNRATATLCAITGNVGVEGGSSGCNAVTGQARLPGVGFIAQRMGGGDNPLDADAPMRKDSVFYQRRAKTSAWFSAAKWYTGGPSTSYLNRVRVADAILRGKEGGYPRDYKMIYLISINWVNNYGNTNRIAEALRKLEFVVSQEQFMTPTAKFADIVLPTCTMWERNDMVSGSLSPFIGYMNKAIEPRAESKSPLDIFYGLGAKMGFTDIPIKTEDEWLREVTKDLGYIPDYDKFKQEGIHREWPAKPLVVWEDQIGDLENHPFPTPSGKIEIYSQDIADLNDPLIPPVAKYIDPWEGPNDPLRAKYPLQLITPQSKQRVHSQFHQIDWIREVDPHSILMHTTDAAARGLKTGDRVRVFNDRGQLLILVKVSERIMPGVASIDEGAWFDPDENGLDRGGCANVLTSDVPSPGGAFNTHAVLVEVEKA